jgi:tetrathionate reductase subunit B
MSTTTKRYAFVIDLSKCIDCNACMIGCKAENSVPIGQTRNWVYQHGPEGTYPDLKMSFEPGNCMHCENPPCVDACPTEATYKAADGIIAINKDLCIGCRACIPACPYNARYYDDKAKKVDKCSFCDHRLKTGLDTACVHTCMTGSRQYGDLNDPNSEVSKLLKKNKNHVKLADKGTGPAVYYID